VTYINCCASILFNDLSDLTNDSRQQNTETTPVTNCYKPTSEHSESTDLCQG